MMRNGTRIEARSDRSPLAESLLNFARNDRNMLSNIAPSRLRRRRLILRLRQRRVVLQDVLRNDLVDLRFGVRLEFRVDLLVCAATLNDHEEDTARFFCVGERLFEVPNAGKSHVAAVDGDDAIALFETGVIGGTIDVHGLDDDAAVWKFYDLPTEIAAA